MLANIKLTPLIFVSALEIFLFPSKSVFAILTKYLKSLSTGWMLGLRASSFPAAWAPEACFTLSCFSCSAILSNIAENIALYDLTLKSALIELGLDTQKKICLIYKGCENQSCVCKWLVAIG